MEDAKRSLAQAKVQSALHLQDAYSYCQHALGELGMDRGLSPSRALAQAVTYARKGGLVLCAGDYRNSETYGSVKERAAYLLQQVEAYAAREGIDAASGEVLKAYVGAVVDTGIVDVEDVAARLKRNARVKNVAADEAEQRVTFEVLGIDRDDARGTIEEALRSYGRVTGRVIIEVA